MFAVIIAIFAAVFALAAVLLLKPERSKEIERRLLALESDAAPASLAALATNVRKKEVPISRFEWLERFIVKVNLQSRFFLFLYQAGVALSLENLLVAAVGCWAAVAVLLSFRTGSFLVSFGIATLALPAPFLWLRRRRAKRLAKIEKQ